MNMNLSDYRKKQMQDPEFRAYAEQLQPFADLAKAVVGARIERNLTQQELSKLTGVAQSDISRLESCEGNPSLKTLIRIAEGMDMRLQVSFVPVIK
jgi:DNA-binding XRE family transcriptional regulator